MKKLLLITVAIFTLSQTSQSQLDLIHEAGASAIWSTADVGIPAITYFVRYNFLEMSDEMTLSASAIPSIGFLLSTQGGGNFFGVDLPLTVDLNLGNRASEDASSAIGGYVGAGLGLNYMASDGGASSSVGPLLQGGIRTTVNWAGSEYNIGLRVSFLAGLGGKADEKETTTATSSASFYDDVFTPADTNPNVFSVGLLYGF